MSKYRWTVASVENRWLRGLAAWAVMTVAAIVCSILILLASIVEAAILFWEGFSQRFQEFWIECVVPAVPMLTFQKGKKASEAAA